MTERAFVIVTTHAPRPEQSPLQSRRVPPDVISVTCVPAGKLAPHTPAEHRSPGIRLVTVPGSGHLSTLEKPEAATKALVEWMEQ